MLPLLARGRRARLHALIVIAAAAVSVILLSLALPRGKRGEILRGIMSGWDVSMDAMRSTLHLVLSSWSLGILFLAPLLVAGFRLLSWRMRSMDAAGGDGITKKRKALPLRVHLLWAGCALTTLLCAKEGAIWSFMPALAPATCLVAALLVYEIPDPRAGSRELRRPVLFALLLPAIFFASESEPEERRRNGERTASARRAQIGAHLRERLAPDDEIAASFTGALAFFSERPVHSISEVTRKGASPLPQVVVFENALWAAEQDEIELFRRPMFLRNYAPVLFRRGATLERQDAVWRRRKSGPAHAADSSAVRSIPEDDNSADYNSYVDHLLSGWDAHAHDRLEAGARAFAAAAAAEPEGLGIAHEWAGILEDVAGRPTAAERQFEIAVVRDAQAARARGHLADRAISAKDLRLAGVLLDESLAWNQDDPEIWGTLARLQVERGDLDEALTSSTRSIMLHPGNARAILNHGSILWRQGDHEAAREFWKRAVRIDPRLLGFLGRFENAPDTAPAPPPIPLFTFAGFAPAPPPRP
jgi:tetratricopeptide (TPR) repeat protein